MAKTVAGTVILPGPCGEDDVTSANLRQMADTLEERPPTEDDRRELVTMLRWLAGFVDQTEHPPGPPVATDHATAAAGESPAAGRGTSSGAAATT